MSEPRKNTTNTDPNITDYLTIDEVCLRLRCSPRTVHRYLNIGILTRHHLGVTTMIDPVEVDRVVKGKHVKKRGMA